MSNSTVSLEKPAVVGPPRTRSDGCPSASSSRCSQSASTAVAASMSRVEVRGRSLTRSERPEELVEALDQVTEIVTGEPVMDRQRECPVHDQVGARKTSPWLAVLDVGEAGLAQDVAGPHHPGGDVALGEELLD